MSENKIFYVVFMLFFIIFNNFTFDRDWYLMIEKMSNSELRQEINNLEQKLKNDKNNPDVIAKIGITYHNLAINNEKVSKKAIDNLEKSISLKYNTVNKAFLGSSYTLYAKEKLDLNKILNKGFNLIDEACIEDKDNYDILITRMSVFVSESLPVFIFRKKVNLILDDIKSIENLYLHKKITENEFIKYLFIKGNFYIKQSKFDEALNIWNDILKKYPNNFYSLKSKIMINKYKKK